MHNVTNRQRALHLCFHGISKTCGSWVLLSVESTFNIQGKKSSMFLSIPYLVMFFVCKKFKLNLQRLVASSERHLYLFQQECISSFPQKETHKLKPKPKEMPRKTLSPQKKFSGPQLQKDVFQDAQAAQHCSTKVLKQLTKAKENQAENFPPKSSRFPNRIPPPNKSNISIVYPKILELIQFFCKN